VLSLGKERPGWWAGGALRIVMSRHAIASERKNLAGNIVLYGFGTSMETADGFVAEMQPKASPAAGLPFGMALCAAADEAAVPALGLSDSATLTPARAHVTGLASHLVYGVSTDLIRRGLNRWVIP